MADWQPIESAPESEEVLLLTREGKKYLATRFGDTWWWARGQFPRLQTPAYWLADLPAPPSEGE